MLKPFKIHRKRIYFIKDHTPNSAVRKSKLWVNSSNIYPFSH
ncbi:hypothetical protein EDF81_0232 [Enterobacter sp. BIGb0383]|nr:hypothetical protein EDF81_0232 [Enterobacter sp. BIGb0383]ROS11919.1 hypothetical protein EC848_0232 [Enterobacter sp. BIGb0359]